MDQPDAGELVFNGQPLPWNNYRKLAEYRNQHIGFIFQEHFLLNTLTSLENIMVPCLVKGRALKKDYELAMFWLKELGLQDRADSFPSELSGGENQRIAVARAMINNPDILLCDEPTGSLDEENSLQLMEALLHTSRKNNTTVILVSHSREIALLMDKQYILNNGNLITDAE